MLKIQDEISANAALNHPLNPALRKIIADHWARAASQGLADQTYIAVIQPGDTEAMLINELGWSPVVDPQTEFRFGEPDFQPYWAWLQDLGGWYQLIHSVGNAGFAYILLIQKSDGVLADLLAMCRRYAGGGQ